jgi:hypothetical protein
LALVALWSGGPAGASEPRPTEGADVETRDFQVRVDGKPSGDARMTFNRQADGTTIVSCDTDLAVKILFVTYKYKYRGREIWKDGRLVRFDSTCDDNGDRFKVQAVADKADLKVRVNAVEKGVEKNEERTMRGDTWPSSYWKQPDNKLINQVLSILDADSGKDLRRQLAFVGVEQRAVADQVQNVNHFRLTGDVNVDLWYDSTGRLCRQEWMEQNHRTLLELTRVRR